MAKTNPIGVRFDPDKMELVKQREKLKSPQEVLNFLLDSYWWQNKLNTAPQQAPAVNMPQVKVKEPEISPYEAYRGDIDRAESIESIKAIDREVQRDFSLTRQEKEALTQIGIEKSKILDI